MIVEQIPLIYDLSLDQIKDIVLSKRWPNYRAIQIWQSLYQQLNDDPSSFTNIPKSIRGVVGACCKRSTSARRQAP